MKPSLQLQLSQQLTLTPQLQQALRLLQLSGLDLQQEIQTALDNNPMLELDDAVEQDSVFEAPLSFDRYEAVHRGADTEFYDAIAHSEEPVTLRAHLLWQLEMSRITPRQQLIGYTIIDAINPAGYLTTALDVLQMQLCEMLNQVSMDEIITVQQLIQQMDPVGCGSLTLQQSLLAQLSSHPASSTQVDAQLLIEHYLEVLPSKKHRQLCRQSGMTESRLQKALALIQTLHPRPGNTIEATLADYIVPDVLLRKRKQQWHVELNRTMLPVIRIHSYYSSLIKRGDSGEQNQFLRNHLQDARSFLRSLHSRQETLLRVSCEIVKRQCDFFEHGEQCMQPMVLADIAAELSMHESTVSRAIANKYIDTPCGIYELKYFFSGQIRSQAGATATLSAIAVKAHIRQLIDNETSDKPLSDSKIATVFAGKGLVIARRTIAKYREALGIPSSAMRKKQQHAKLKAQS